MDFSDYNGLLIQWQFRILKLRQGLREPFVQHVLRPNINVLKMEKPESFAQKTFTCLDL